MQRISCLYCGNKFWQPLKWLRDGEFCSAEHRASYQGRLRKIAGNLTTHVQLENPALPAPQAEMKDEQLERESPLLATFLPLSNDLSIAPLKRGPAMTEPLPSPFETHARIKRWGLRIKFFGQRPVSDASSGKL